MLAIFINFLAVILGSAIGALARRGIREKYITVLNTAMGLTAIVLGINVAMQSMQTSEYPVLFIFCLSFGGLFGTLLRLDSRLERATSRMSNGSELSKGIPTSILLCCVGTLAIMGPVNSALSGDNTFLMTLATMNLVTMVVMASTYGFGVAITSVVVFLWLSGIYGIATLSAEFISPQLTSEISIVGGILIAASGLGVLNIKDCKTINLLPALLMPMLFFLGKRVIEMIF
jgi:uncharacterized membrane protein YqgA involved in biofilm formation